MSHQRNDTRYTKIFVGGLAWETQRETMKMYFEQFGEILEAVVITDKNTGRSKGYGFVTFKEAEAAYRACQNPSPVIDGRRANCNLAALGAQKSQNVGGSTGRFREATSMGAANPFTGSSSSYFPHSSSPQFPFSYSTYGYSGYSHDTIYPMSYYGMYGQQFSPFYPSGAVATTAATATATVPPTGYFPNMYQYYGPYAQSSYHGHGYGVQYPTHMHQIYPFLPHHLASTPLPISSSLPISSGTQGATMTIGIAGSTSMPGPSQSTPRPVSEQNSTA